MTQKIITVAGARPNFMKVAPILSALRADPQTFTPLLVHTGQHYDYQMSEVFFDELELPPPDAYLDAGRQHPVQQTADIIAKFDEVLVREKPDLVLVVGDVTSTDACAITASKRQVPIAHVEAGLRSRDRRMPEELTRMVTDALSDLLFTYSDDADANLRAENVPAECIFQVGNVMIDTFLRFRDTAAQSTVLETLGIQPKQYVLATMHRPSNVDDAETLSGLLGAFAEIGREIAIVFQLHPRTKERIERFGLQKKLDAIPNVHLIGPQGYLDIVKLQENARLALTDSAGIAEETTALQVPCLTLRENTERPITITHGSNQLVGCDPQKVVATARAALSENRASYPVPPLWDGHSAERLVEVLRRGIARRLTY